MPTSGWQRMHYLPEKGVHKHQDLIKILQELKTSVAAKDQDRSKTVLQNFMQQSGDLQKDVDSFVKQGCQESENFAYWYKFITYAGLARDMVRADREGDWQLHLLTVQNVLPLFAVFDKVNYLRWCSVYIEDMRQLPHKAPEIWEAFMDGRFVVKRKGGLFNAVGADLCLEQTINRSQKSASGIIGSTKQKSFVAKWELIYHEMFALSKAQRELSEIPSSYYELNVHQEFRESFTDASEDHIKNMISSISSHENQICLSVQFDSKLHNIITQALMTGNTR